MASTFLYSKEDENIGQIKRGATLQRRQNDHI